ncbi:hypothetical protein N7512_007520 [Penicillium capsulatum]|nr:hypothetical protein N7512_007520 [Penicillium capsulatum]
MYGRWPEPKSVLLMDNASFLYVQPVRELSSNRSVKLFYLPPYHSIGVCQMKLSKHTDEDFKDFFEWSLDVVEARGESARF